MKHLITCLALGIAFAAGAQTGLVEFPYNPDADNDDIIGINDLLELLSLFGGEFSEESLFLNESETSAIYHIEGAWNYGMCQAKCFELPSGKWRMLDFNTWAEFHNEVEEMTTIGTVETWLIDEPMSFGYSSSNLGGLVIGGDNQQKGALDVRSIGDDKTCVCVTHERPKVEYSVVVGQFEANEPQYDLELLSNEKTQNGWYPLGSAITPDGSWHTQTFWRWAE